MHLGIKKRTKYEITYLILKKSETGTTEDELMLKYNFSKKTINRFLSKLMEQKLIKLSDENKYILTDEGKEALRILEKTMELEKKMNGIEEKNLVNPYSENNNEK